MTKQEQQELNNQLLDAVYNNNLTKVKELLGRGTELEAKDKYAGVTPLHIASHYDFLEIVKELLGRGAELDLQTLSKYPEESLINIHKKVKMEDEWSSAFMFIIRNKDKYSDSKFKKYILEFLEKTKNEMPENIYIILNTLI